MRANRGAAVSDANFRHPVLVTTAAGGLDIHHNVSLQRIKHPAYPHDFGAKAGLMEFTQTHQLVRRSWSPSALISTKRTPASSITSRSG